MGSSRNFEALSIFGVILLVAAFLQFMDDVSTYTNIKICHIQNTTRQLDYILMPHMHVFVYVCMYVSRPVGWQVVIGRQVGNVGRYRYR